MLVRLYLLFFVTTNTEILILILTNFFLVLHVILGCVELICIFILQNEFLVYWSKVYCAVRHLCLWFSCLNLNGTVTNHITLWIIVYKSSLKYFFRQWHYKVKSPMIFLLFLVNNLVCAGKKLRIILILVKWLYLNLNKVFFIRRPYWF